MHEMGEYDFLVIFNIDPQCPLKDIKELRNIFQTAARMPRLPKWLLMKEWLTYEDVVKVVDSSPTELENIFARDESEEFGYSYKFVCTFAPRVCKREVREYRFEQTARQNMRAHLKEHIRDLKAALCDDGTEFLTRNQMFQHGKSSKHKLSVTKSEVPSKKSKIVAKSNETVVVKETGKQKTAQKKRQKKQFTEIKQSQSDRENIQKSPLPSSKKIDVIEEVGTTIKENEKVELPKPQDVSSAESHDILRDLGLEDLDEDNEMDDDSVSDKINCETQTDHGKKEMETIQYRLAMRLFSLPRSQWVDLERAIDDLIARENAVDEISKNDRKKLLEAMNQFIDSVQLQKTHRPVSLQDPLTPAEEARLNSLTVQDWKRLNAARDPESKLRLTVYARLLLRDYVWVPRKNKPRYCKHCQKHYTASTSLQSHLISLSGIRYWTCSRCKESSKEEVTFTRKHSLQYHILKEVGIPRYRCSQPGCSKTHNHTHHQKSHARQHTGEQYYKCAIAGCKVRFSNRNTYSRHLLQNHNTELTSDNKLQPIAQSEAQMKVFAARMRARERSKCKRQSPETAVKEPKANKLVMQDRSLNRLDTSDLSDASSNVVTVNLEKYMRPSASQLLYGIARDVRKTTSTIEGRDKPGDNMLGGLNLLATVSKYMNAETCDSDQLKQDKPENSMRECTDKVSPNIFSDGLAGNISQTSSGLTIESSMSSFPRVSYQSSLSQQNIQSEQSNAMYSQVNPDILTKYQLLTSPDLKSVQEPSASQHPPSIPASIEESPMSSKVKQPALNSVLGTSEGITRSALNVHVLGNKWILKPPHVVNATVTPQAHTPSQTNSEALMNNDMQREKSIVSRVIMNVSQFPETSKNDPQFSNVKIVHPKATDSSAESSTILDVKTNKLIGNSPEIKKDHYAPQSQIVDQSQRFALRSVSSVSGKTYIVLASSTKGSYVHKLQPYFKDVDSKAVGNLDVGTPIPLS